MKQEDKYPNTPPKDIQNVIWGECFDYKDFDEKIMGKTVRDRIYDTWQTLHLILKNNINEERFINLIKNEKQD